MSKVQTFDRRLLTRRCLSCGYDGALLRGGLADHCARCGCDLRLRPARSYAEMEGLLGQPLTIDAPQQRPGRDERLVQKWLTFLFFSALLVMTLGCLVASVVDV
jgi:hypothetical protein